MMKSRSRLIKPGKTTERQQKGFAGKRRLTADERRSQIVDGAIAYFSEVGMGGTTRELSKRLGIAQPLIFRYFKSKSDLVDEVYRVVFLNRLSATWPQLIADENLSIRVKLVAFYTEYTRAIYDYQWMRIFMFSGLAGSGLTQKYFKHLTSLVLHPILLQLKRMSAPDDQPNMEDVWNLHGSLVYVGLRKFIYQTPCPDNYIPAMEAAIDRFLRGFGIDTD